MFLSKLFDFAQEDKNKQVHKITIIIKLLVPLCRAGQLV